MVRSSFTALVAIVVAGCASSPSGEAFQPEVVEPGKAVMYIYRPPQGLGGGSVNLFVNQEPAGALSPGQYLAQVVKPGTYLVRVEAKSSMVREVRLVPGDVAYLQVSGSSRPILEFPDSDVARQQLTRSKRVGD